MTTVPTPVREPAWSLSRSAITLWVTEGAIGSLALGIGAAAFAIFVPGDLGGPLPALRWLVPIAAVLYAVVTVGIRPWFRFRVHRWEVTTDAVYTLTGWLTRTWTLVPISRIQTVDVTRGVLQQLFGLSTVAVLTASSQGTVRVWHLEADVAQRVADDLAHRAEQVRDTAT
jgi:membrane protein YdbS with pleckstrin-like domain